MSTAERVTASLNTYRALPKVELHRHLEGSLRLDTMVDIARQHGITIPADVLRLSTLVQVQEEDKFTFQNFLAKFNTLRLFYRSPDAIYRITHEAIEDAAKDNVRYMELRFLELLERKLRDERGTPAAAPARAAPPPAGADAGR